MGIYSFLNRSAKKDEQITKLEGQVEGLTEQNKRLVTEKERLELTWKTNYDDVQARFDMAHKVEVNQAEVIKTQKQTIADLQAEAERFREQITTLQEKSVTLANEKSAALSSRMMLPEDVLIFLRRLKKGDFRSDRDGPQRYDDAVTLLWTYDRKDDKPVLSK